MQDSKTDSETGETARFRCPPELADSRILVVDDEEANTRALSRVLKQAGFRSVETANDSRVAVRMIASACPDLLITDIRMPHMTGLEMMAVLSDEVNAEVSLPVLMITGDNDPSLERRCLEAGARDFVNKPFRPSEILLRIRNLLETRALQKRLAEDRSHLASRLSEEEQKASEAQLEILRRLAMAAEFRDDLTGKHAERVGAIAEAMALELGQSTQASALIRQAAPLHDVGKIGIPDSILLKPGSLDAEEFAVMKTHTVIGARLLSKNRSFPLLDLARQIAMNHHERFDGCGYPQGLMGNSIPLSGRIVAVADVFDSLTHERPYKRAFSAGTAVDLMNSQRALHFDPVVLEVFLDLHRRGVIDEVIADVEGGFETVVVEAAGASRGGWLAGLFR